MEELGSAELFGDDFGGERMWGLRELFLPGGTGWFPETIGWVYLSVLLLALTVIYCLHRYHHWKTQAYRRDAIKSLTLMRDELSQTSSMQTNPLSIRDLPRLLRLVALTSSTREQVTKLHGQSWINWLNTKAGKQIFQVEDAEFLSQLAYANPDQIDLERSRHLITAVELWVSMDHV